MQKIEVTGASDLASLFLHQGCFCIAILYYILVCCQINIITHFVVISSQVTASPGTIKLFSYHITGLSNKAVSDFAAVAIIIFQFLQYIMPVILPCATTQFQ